jgi:hypothetical protein
LVSQASTRLIANLFSLPIPPGYSNGFEGDATLDSSRFVPDYLDQKRVQKLLLVGLDGSGSSTIFKQVFALLAHTQIMKIPVFKSLQSLHTVLSYFIDQGKEFFVQITAGWDVAYFFLEQCKECCVSFH